MPGQVPPETPHRTRTGRGDASPEFHQRVLLCERNAADRNFVAVADNGRKCQRCTRNFALRSALRFWGVVVEIAARQGLRVLNSVATASKSACVR